ncbi:MAG: 50S ribosomal protein L11 methyltransferase, partial [Clostridia bacterium]|nr:50S ribosomal protein L11 methyltransferase [Clostridia bacterium]
VIVPAWERFDPLPDDIVVRMDPGMAFGTGTHETTRLVIELLEKYVKKGQRMLDVGTGSGILAICASKLGAEHCAAYDIDPVAVRVARDNIAESGQQNITCEVSDLLKQVSLEGGQYDIVTANIVADIIIRMAPDIGKYMKEGAPLIASGIITERKDEVLEVLLANNLKLVEILEDNGWCAIVVKK